MVEGDTDVVLTRESALPMRMGPVSLRLRPQSFFQTNTAVATELYAQVSSWVDEVVVSWAACLLGDPRLSTLAVAALADGEHAGPAPGEFRRLTQPDDHDRRAGALLRHPDLLGPVADLHRPELLVRLGLGTAGTAAA